MAMGKGKKKKEWHDVNDAMQINEWMDLVSFDPLSCVTTS